MTALLILMYILTANGIVVPTSCFVITWLIWSLKLMASVVKSVLKLSDKN